MIFWIGFAIYVVLGIGYAKSFTSLIKEQDMTPFAFALILWPLFLVIAAFWNFDNERT